jgi:cysteine desulfurase/selenocysteine lyase
MPPNRRVSSLAFPGHKSLYGPTGTGALYVGPRTDGKITPWREGGTGGDSASPTQPLALPHFLEGGTPNVLGFAGLVAGIGYVIEEGQDTLRKHEVALLSRIVEWAETMDDWRVVGRWDPDTHVGALSLVVPDELSPQEFAGALDDSVGVAVRRRLQYRR